MKGTCAGAKGLALKRWAVSCVLKDHKQAGTSSDTILQRKKMKDTRF